MRALSPVLGVSVTAIAIGCGPEPLPTIPEPPGPKMTDVTLAAVGLDRSAMKEKADPCVDFYQFACGQWEEKTKIPDDKPRWNRSFSEIHKQNIADLKQIVETASTAAQGDLVMTKLGDFYAACMDEATIEKAGVRGIKPLWTLAAKVKALVPDPPPPPEEPDDEKKGTKKGKKPKKDLKDTLPKGLPAVLPPSPPAPTEPIEKVVAELHRYGVHVFFDVTAGQDFKDATKMIAHVDQNGLGLPDRDFYLEAAQRDPIREPYMRHVAKMLTLAGYSLNEGTLAAENVWRIETELAKIAKSRVDRRDPAGMYNKIDRPGLRERSTGLAWDDYIKGRRMDHVMDVSVTSIPYVEAMGALVAKLKQTELRHYLQWHVVHSFAAHLSKKFVDEDFELIKALSGQGAQRPRWKRCVEATDGALGELLAQPYVKRRFSAQSKMAVQTMVTEISDVFRGELGSLEWMNDTTRDAAAEKLDKMAYLIGYPDKWRTYDFQVDRKRHTANVLAAYAFEIRRDIAKIGKPIDRGEWYMTPPTVNAYYTPLKNQMVFPAGILQPPFFNPSASVAVNLGGMGMVVGHELTHGFDDQGSQFDGNGNLKNWWDADVRKRFKARTDCMVKQYDGYEVLPGVRLNGKLTLGENIADAGGVKLAYHAFRKMRENATEMFIADGYNEDKQFFISVGQIWCSKYRPEFAKLRAKTDYHAQPNWRVNGALANTPEFGEVFSCPVGSPMRPAETCSVW